MKSVVLGVAGLLLLGLSGPAPGAVPEPPRVVFVAPDGNDENPGTESLPLLSLEKAAEGAAPGDTIYMRGGTYSISRSIHLTLAGEPGVYVRIFAYPEETPILDGATMESTGYWAGWVLDLHDISWVHIRGIEIKNGPEGGVVIRGTSSHNVIERLNVHHNGRLSLAEGKGISLYESASANLLLNNDSHRNEDLKGANADGFSISVSGYGNVLRGNRAWRNSDDGFDFFNLHDNTVGAPILIERNYAWENGFNDSLEPKGNGIGFKLGGARPGTRTISGGHIVRHNLSWNNSARAFDENGATNPSVFYQNRTEPSTDELTAAFGPPPAW